MDMNIPPLLSRTPPPLSDPEINDTDFGNFVLCNDAGAEVFDDYQCGGKISGVEDSASEDSGLCTGSSSMGQAHSPYETSPTTGHKGLPNGDVHLLESLSQQESVQDLKHLPHQRDGDIILVDKLDEGAQIEVSQLEIVGDDLKVATVQSDSSTLLSSDGVSQSTLTQEELDTSLTSVSDTIIQDVNQIDEDNNFNEFSEFKGPEKNNLPLPPCDTTESSASSECEPARSTENECIPERLEVDQDNWVQYDNELSDLQTDGNDFFGDDEDEFSEFQTSDFPPISLSIQSKEEPLSFTSFLSDNLSQVPSAEHEMKEIISSTDSVPIPALRELLNRNLIWSYLRSPEETNAIRYQWSSSSSNQKFLTALKIDARNILCSFLNKSLRSYDQEFSLDCLHVSEQIDPTKISSIKNVVPDAHFDWVGSGLTNPLDCGSTTLLDMPHLNFTCASKGISNETPLDSSCMDEACVSSITELEFRYPKISPLAEEILSSLPDLSYLKKTYIIFKKTS